MTMRWKQTLRRLCFWLPHLLPLRIYFLKDWLLSFILSSFLSLTEHLSSRTVITFLLHSRQKSKQYKTELQTGDEEMPRSDWLFGEIHWRVCAGRKTRPQGKHACRAFSSFSRSLSHSHVRVKSFSIWCLVFGCRCLQRIFALCLAHKAASCCVSLVASVSISRAIWTHYNKAGLGLLIQEMVLIFSIEKIYSQPQILIDLLVQIFYSF